VERALTSSSICLSERVVKKIHHDPHPGADLCGAWTPSLGLRKSPGDIPNVGEAAPEQAGRSRYRLRMLELAAILVGGTPGAARPNPTPEEKLLRAIFGRKAS